MPGPARLRIPRYGIFGYVGGVGPVSRGVWGRLPGLDRPSVRLAGRSDGCSRQPAGGVHVCSTHDTNCVHPLFVKVNCHPRVVLALHQKPGGLRLALLPALCDLTPWPLP